MDSRLFFVLGDLFANILVGAVAGWVCTLIIDPGSNMFFAMLLAMLIGMVVGTVLWLPLSIKLGAMEVMVPTMFTGMVSGMVLGMWAAMAPIESGFALFLGGVCGLASIVFIWIFNNALRGVQPTEATH